MAIINDKNKYGVPIKRYPKDKYKSLGEFIRKIGGYKYYYKWIRENPIVIPKKIGRNEKCPCESGKKYKKCCINKLNKGEI